MSLLNETIEKASWLYKYIKLIAGFNCLNDIKIFSIEFSSVCNLRCKYCFLDQLDRPKFLDYQIRRNYFDELKPWLEENDIKFLDLLEAMKRTPGNYYPKNGEVHFNPQGHQFTAERLKEAFDQFHWL